MNRQTYHPSPYRFIFIGLALGLLLSPGMPGIPPAVAADKAADETEKSAEKTKPLPEPLAFTTHHQGRFGGKTLRYTAVAGDIRLTGKDGAPTAAVFTVSYLKDGVKDASKRPVTFIFNGGPGSASIWLHMGLFGPRRVVVASDANTDDGAAPYRLVDNAESLLDITDLVMVDPVGTGYSRVIGKGETKDFWGIDEDARSMADFIRRWVSQNKRWNSPKFYAGESFGTTRGATIARALLSGSGNISLNGMILISQALDYTGSTPAPDNLIAYVTYLPSMAAVAWYHQRVSPRPDSLAAFVAEAKKFAIDEYLPALFRGGRLDATTRAHIAERLAYFTGLSEDYVLRSNLRIMVPRFAKQLLRDKGLAVGRLDGRYTGDELDDIDDRIAADAASYAIGSAYTALLNDYYSRELGVSIERPYITSSREAGEKWRYRTVPEGKFYEPAYLDVGRRLATAMRDNPTMRVMLASGYYDLITPFLDAEYTFARHGIDLARIDFSYYEGGHMMYLHQPSRLKLIADMRRFIATGTSASGPTGNGSR